MCSCFILVPKVVIYNLNVGFVKIRPNLGRGFASCPPPLLPHPPNPTAITHLLYATKFHVLVEENSIRTSRWKCSCKLAWSSQNSGEGERDFTLSRAVIPTLNNAYSPSPSASCGQLHARPHSLTSASLCIIVYYTDIWRAKFSMKAQHFF